MPASFVIFQSGSTHSASEDWVGRLLWTKGSSPPGTFLQPAQSSYNYNPAKPQASGVLGFTLGALHLILQPCPVTPVFGVNSPPPPPPPFRLPAFPSGIPAFPPLLPLLGSYNFAAFGAIVDVTAGHSITYYLTDRGFSPPNLASYTLPPAPAGGAALNQPKDVLL